MKKILVAAVAALSATMFAAPALAQRHGHDGSGGWHGGGGDGGQHSQSQGQGQQDHGQWQGRGQGQSQTQSGNQDRSQHQDRGRWNGGSALSGGQQQLQQQQFQQQQQQWRNRSQGGGDNRWQGQRGNGDQWRHRDDNQSAANNAQSDRWQGQGGNTGGQWQRRSSNNGRNNFNGDRSQWSSYSDRRSDPHYDRYRNTHSDFDHPRYTDWRNVPRGGYFDNGYARIVGSYYHRNYRWWSYGGWDRPYRPWRVGYIWPSYLFWEPVPYDLYYELPPAPYGCRYVYYDGDILLIALATGIVLDALMYY